MAFTQSSQATLALQKPALQSPGSIPTVVHWFRLDSLRLHDNPAFTSAVASAARSKSRLKTIVIIDSWFNATPKQGPGVNVWRFILEALNDVDSQLQKQPYRTRLNVLVGTPTKVLPQLFKQWNVTTLTFQASQMSKDSVKYDEMIQFIAKAHNVEVGAFHSHTLYDPRDIASLNGAQVPLTYSEFRQLLPVIGRPREPIPSPSPVHCFASEEIDEQEGKIPTLQDLGFGKEEQLYTGSWIGGESQVLSQLSNFCIRRTTMSNDPVSWLLNKNTVSPYIRFGCLSVRQLFSQCRQFASTSIRGHALFEQITKNLLLREFAFLVGTYCPQIDRMEGNPLCIQLPWDNNERFLHAWREGRTGYPWIDAVVRQIRKEGWAHFLARQSIAVFLTRGYMWVSWEHGVNFFQEFMLDFELPVSSICWMQSSCSGFFCNQIEAYDPCMFGKQMDPEGHFIKMYVPELSYFPSEYIHQPSQAPEYIQREAGCIIGKDYPEPIVQLCEQGQLCCKRVQSVMHALSEMYNTKDNYL